MGNVWEILRGSKVNWLLVFLPISVVVELLHLPDIWLFVTSAIAIIPLAHLIGEATEQLAIKLGPTMGGFMNATFGNAAELIIGIFALKAGLYELVKASISGSIIGNILLILGLSMLVGGWGRVKQTFDQTAARVTSTMMLLATVALVMPAFLQLEVIGTRASILNMEEHLSIVVSIILLLTYGASLIFTLKTHQPAYGEVGVETEHAKLSKRAALVLLALATAGTAFEAELLTSGVTAATETLGLSEFFIGIIVVAIVGNAAEHYSAIVMARRNRMDLAVTIATASSTQIALLVAPLLVFISLLFGEPMTLVFNGLEIIAIALSVAIATLVSLDGESNWFEGLQLVVVYIILAVVFYFIPAGGQIRF